MKANLLTIAGCLLPVIMWAQTPYTETFESATNNATSFTSNSQVFNITATPAGAFYIQGGYPGTGWNGTGVDNKYIDNSGHSTFGTNCNFTIATQGNTPFTLKSFWIFLSDNSLNQGVSGGCTVTGKLGGVTKFTVTQTTGFNTSTSTDNGYTFIDMTTYGGSDNSTTLIDQFTVSTSGSYYYAGLDAMTWEMNTLAVNWINFTGSLDASGHARLAWKVQEQDVMQYAVERSPDGRLFNTIGTIAGLGDGEHTYSFQDMQASTGAAFYRIVQTNVDGRITYSNIIRVADHGKNNLLFAWPVPARSVLNFSFSADTPAAGLISGGDGRIVERVQLQPGVSILDVSKFAPGEYILRLVTGASVRFMKF